MLVTLEQHNLILKQSSNLIKEKLEYNYSRSICKVGIDLYNAKKIVDATNKFETQSKTLTITELEKSYKEFIDSIPEELLQDSILEKLKTETVFNNKLSYIHSAYLIENIVLQKALINIDSECPAQRINKVLVNVRLIEDQPKLNKDVAFELCISFQDTLDNNAKFYIDKTLGTYGKTEKDGQAKVNWQSGKAIYFVKPQKVGYNIFKGYASLLRADGSSRLYPFEYKYYVTK